MSDFEARNVDFDNDTRNFDMISELYSMNLINVIGNILDELSTACLQNFRLVCSLYKKLVDSDKRSVNRMFTSRCWLLGQPRVLPVCLHPGHMITSLASNGDSIIFGLLGYDATVNVFKKDDLSFTARLVQSRDFPASISGLDYNSTVIVTCAYESMNGAILGHAVYIWWLQTKNLASKITPHTEMIRAVKLTDKYLLTASNDKTIAVTDITNPNQPKLIHRLVDHLDFLSSIDCDERHLVSVSVDNVLKVWNLKSLKCIYSFQTVFPTLKVAMSWPLAATGGQHIVLLWNVEKGHLIRELSLSTNSSISSMAMTWCPKNQNGVRRSSSSSVHVVVGDNRGFISVWDTSIIIAGHATMNPHRILQIGSSGNMISSVSVDESSIVSGDWSGQVLSWRFIDTS